MCEYLRKIAVCALISQKWHQNQSAGILFCFWRSCFYLVLFGQVRGNLGKNGAWSALIWKNAPNIKRNAVVFLEVILFGVVFGQVWGNLGKNPSHPQKFAYSYTYVANNLKKIRKTSLQPPEKISADAHDQGVAFLPSVFTPGLFLSTHPGADKNSFVWLPLPFYVCCAFRKLWNKNNTLPAKDPSYILIPTELPTVFGKTS